MAEPLKIKDLPKDARPREAFMRSAAPERDIPDAYKTHEGEFGIMCDIVKGMWK